MNKKHEQRRRDIKSKLTAAICMLLVSSIMMVSSTYAWFTLSTAPEVTGITTAVGANGNLEMALLPYGQTTVAESAVGDGAKETVAAKNVTWGNLVNVSSGYGLDKITLLPSALNLTGDGKVNVTAGILAYPEYGADGRIMAQLKTGTSAYAYNSDNASTIGFLESVAHNGVRGVGVNSGLTPKQSAFRNALSNGNSLRGSAAGTAKNTLATNGSALGNIAIRLAMETAPTFNQTDVGYLKTMTTDLETALTQVEKSYMQYLVAYAASTAVTGDLAYGFVENWVNADGATLSSVITNMKNQSSDFGAAISIPEGVEEASAKLADTKTAVENTLTSLNQLTGDSISADDMKSAVEKLADTSKMTISDGGSTSYTISQAKEKVGEVAGWATEGKLTINMGVGSGAFADIAYHTGTYSTAVKVEITSGTYAGLKANVTMKAVAADSGKLVALNTTVKALEPVEDIAGAAAKPLTDMYGYIIDMAFRTNASGSKLMLQVNPADRIYSDNTNADTMGGGASMTFQAADGFLDAQVKELMKAIKIVFFNTDDGTIYNYARLDAEHAVAGETGLTAKLVLQKKQTAEDTNTTTWVDATADTNGNYEIMDLVQNTTTKLSVLVYLDGEKVTNKDVAFNAEKSMTGKMNLQFSSNANLVPMEYADLHQKGTTTESSTPTPSATTDATVPSGSGVSDETLEDPSI